MAVLSNTSFENIRMANSGNTLKKEMVARFHETAAKGDAAKLSTMLTYSTSLVDEVDEKGWTALMYASRNGHFEVARLLLEKGCNRSLSNKSGQTAQDIAKFWGYRTIADLLANPTLAAGTGTRPDGLQEENENYFGRTLLNKLSEKRSDSNWLKAKQIHPATVYILFSNLNPLVISPKYNESRNPDIQLCRLNYEDVEQVLAKPEVTSVFLGVEQQNRTGGSQMKCLESEDSADDDGLLAWFALNSNYESADNFKIKSPGCCFLQPVLPHLLNLNQEEAGVVAQARSVLDWHNRYRFCPTCGSDTKVTEGGYKRVCLKENCPSLQGIQNTSYPRVGETIEDAVRREVAEETTVNVGHVQYVSSQPWPLPSSLMIGCLANALSTEIIVDKAEIVDAQWFSRQQIIEIMTEQDHPISIPPQQTIANQLIKQWLKKNANL
ncbi:NAD-capped RNA hydrolase NUDT12 isoform X5 [Mobula birostris]|uniref:NAD-capped RNA hydrolase NUDT12 isoform X5 n=1 Tax=Mobula birostris TaxID=1983395 RepID=UPI003B27D2EA